ncbi:MAG TPA: hypothetical protein HPP83_10190, partial [Candidatus Hydrogenedentes bacterium]|nr:hypothetical protein [Candidatus Hydrogenedentota bacterium]
TFSEEMAPELAAELRSQYDGLKDEGKVPEEHVALFDELVAIGGAEEGSAWGKMLCLTVVVSSLEDGKVTEAEVGVLEDARDLLQENPDIGLFGMRRFFEHRPEMQAEMQRYQTRYPRGGY